MVFISLVFSPLVIPEHHDFHYFEVARCLRSCDAEQNGSASFRFHSPNSKNLKQSTGIELQPEQTVAPAFHHTNYELKY